MVARRKRREPTPYPSDLTDSQWELIAPMVPAALPGGRPAIHDRRRIVEAILYVNRTGCSWRQLPHDFPPWQTVFGYFQRWNESRVTDRIHDALRAKLRDHSGRDPMASAGMVDAQAIRGADTVDTDTRGWDGGKRVNGRKRHVVTDSLGQLVVVLVTAACKTGTAGAPGVVSGEDSDAVDGVGVGVGRRPTTLISYGNPRGRLDSVFCYTAVLSNGVDRALPST